METEGGGVAGIYCHWDGSPAWAGRTLLDHYRDAETVRRLISGGALSSLAPAIDPPEGVSHSFNAPADGVCIYYHRDRGDGERPEIMQQATRGGWEVRCRGTGAEFLYLFTAKGWRWKPAGARGPWRVLRCDSAAPAESVPQPMPGYPGPCPDGVDWSAWLAFNNVD
jgi:hypothetical protein